MASRSVIHGDALAWLAEHPSMAGASLLTSLPDMAELSMSEERWRVVFSEAARLCLQAVPAEGVAVFFQTDTRIGGRWVSKSALVLAEAAALGVGMLWHKVVCRRPPDTRLTGRPGFAHLLAFSREGRIDPVRSRPDVLPGLGDQPWSHSMGLAAAEEALSAIALASPTTTVVLAPFCGVGTALAVANARGYDAIGVERSRKRSERSRRLVLEGDSLRLPVTTPDRRAAD
jgi:hypothetical protein